jgi:hypothetical protein
MDHPERPTTYRRVRGPQPARRHHPGFHACLGFGTTLVGFVLLTSGAHAPSYGTVVAPEASAQVASLTRNGADVVITGSVQSVFEAPGLVGPNRAEKVNRARITPGALEFAAGFIEARLQLASLRATAFSEDAVPADRVASVPVTPLPPQPSSAEAPRVAVASLGPAPATPALSAIESIAPGAGAPVPLVLSEELAYARAEAPVTSFPTQPVDANGNVVSEKDLWCMSQAIYFEARSESYKGQIAVAQVVLNRLHHRLYPKTICGVVFQNQQMRNACQFSFACDGIPERVTDAKAWRQAQEIAKGAIAGKLYVKEVGKATHYHAAYVRPAWAPRMKKVTRIGLHIFYQFKRNWRYG